MSLRRGFALLLSGRRKNFQLAKTKESPCYIATSLQSQNIYISWTKGTPPIEINVFFRASPLFRTSKTTFYAYDRKIPMMIMMAAMIIIMIILMIMMTK